MISKMLKNIWFWFATLPFLYLLCGFFLLPWLTQTQLPSFLKKHYNIHLSLEKVIFNPLTYELELKNSVLKNANGDTLVGIKHIYLDYNPSALLHKEIVITQFLIEEPFMDASLDANGTLNLLELIPSSASQSDPEEDNATQAPLPLIVKHFAITNATGKFTDNQPSTPFSVTLGPIHYTADNLNFSKDDLSIHALNIALENQEKISLASSMSFNPFKLHGKLLVEHFPLPFLWDYFLPSMPAKLVDGTLGAQIPFTLSLIEKSPHLSLEKATITFDKLAFLDKNNRKAIMLPSLSLEGFDLLWPKNSANLQTLLLSQPFIALSLEKNYMPNLVSLFTLPKASSSTSDSLASSQEPWNFTLENLLIEKGTIELIDRNANGAQTTFSELFLKAQTLSLDTNQSIPYEFKSQIDKTSHIALKGTFNGLLNKLDTTLNIESLPLNKAQPYLRPFTTLLVAKGLLSSQSHLTLLLGNSFDLLFQGAIDINHLALNDAAKKPLMAWEQLKITDLNYGFLASFLHVKKIELVAPYVNLDIKKDGGTNFSSLAKAQKSSSAQPKEESAKKIEIRIGETILKEGRANFKDASLPIPFATLIHQLNGSFSALDTKNTKPSTLTLNGKVDKYGYANIKGTLLPFDFKNSAHLKILFKNIDMPSLTPYSGKFIGYAIDKGKLSMDLSYKIKNGLMEGDNKINLDSLSLGKPIESEEAINLPLHLAIALLKDSKGQIDIDLPVNGNLNDPNFAYGALVWKAFGNLLGSIIASPFNLIGSLLGIQTENLKSIDFAAGTHVLIVSEDEKMEQYKTILEKKPELKLRITPSFNEEIDTLGLKQQEIAKQIDAMSKNAKPGEDSYAKALKTLYVKYYSEQEYTQFLRDAGEAKLDKGAINEKLKGFIAQSMSISQQELQVLAQKRAETIISAMHQKHAIPRSKLLKTDVQSSSAIRETWVGCAISISN